ncbi:Hsp20/alpha crystallin family protein [Alkalitalea saponilacus]|uniref:HSP20 family protein n=1 Tax=Alkalitalea saponilacus TaxID=889453 RepID=A0A1T5C8L1_9BACT|nr:Hsp20/alpha crystallin family protein [Alkalitalea saponilacus]ASB49768.1 heat-shock protein [Alkalitalea saponilacus]SKB55729.1 HSP20 family protein [Alkalitalea saponilacus]
MKIAKWTTQLKPKITGFFGKMFGNNDESLPVNVADRKSAFNVQVALPGLDKKDVRIEVKNNHLVISSQKDYSKEEKNESWIRREYGYSSFSRSFRLPESADQDKIDAHMKNGILSISVGKKKGSESNIRRIAIA